MRFRFMVPGTLTQTHIIMETQKKMSLSLEFSHEFELSTQTQNSPKTSHLTQNSDSNSNPILRLKTH
jgi:hypothetical protein